MMNRSVCVMKPPSVTPTIFFLNLMPPIMSLARPWMNSKDFIHTWKGIIQTNQQTIKVALDLNNR